MAADPIYHYTNITKGGTPIVNNIIRKDAIYLYSSYYRKYAEKDYLWIKNCSKDIVENICIENNWSYDKEDLTIQPYFISFCIDADCTYMWENYADNGRGVKIIFDKHILSNCNHHINIKDEQKSYAIESSLPCIYINSSEDLKSVLLENIEIPELQCWSYFDRLKFLVSAVKQSRSYKEEQEYRHIHLHPIISVAKYNEGNFYFQNDNGPTESNNMSIDLRFPKEMLLGIELGCNTTSQDLTNIREHIKSVGYDPTKLKIYRHK